MSTETPQPQSVTLEQIEASIASQHYFTAYQGATAPGSLTVSNGDGLARVSQDLTLLTICVLRLRSGFTVLGQSACVDPLKFDAAIGRTWAYKDALAKCWPLFGFQLKERMHVERTATADTEGGEA